MKFGEGARVLLRGVRAFKERHGFGERDVVLGSIGAEGVL